MKIITFLLAFLGLTLGTQILSAVASCPCYYNIPGGVGFSGYVHVECHEPDCKPKEKNYFHECNKFYGPQLSWNFEAAKSKCGACNDKFCYN